MGETSTSAVLYDAVFELLAGVLVVLVVVLVVTVAVLVVQNFDLRHDLAEARDNLDSRPRHRRPATTAPWPPPPSRQWRDPDPAGWVPCATETATWTVPVVDRWPFDLADGRWLDQVGQPDIPTPIPISEARPLIGPLLRNPWEDPPAVTPVPWPDPDPATRYEAWPPAHDDVADDLEPIADPEPDDATLAELGERWIAAEAQAAEHGWPPLITASPVEKPAEPPVTSDRPAGHDKEEPPGPEPDWPAPGEVYDYAARLGIFMDRPTMQLNWTVPQ